ncbi:BirA family transcriptional regulator, biotin operon repressor / biotin-[acetyl-CoA-carboxylase] ligase [Nocardioides alpinus]|uniref:biotin--[biotin carboxyl-carrier protein] ligase n=1 Tax=Nocardioides alpinus TaxID=748909 RepID=A0A1I1ADX6_9ACTN|nr:biotin--[acetyl-CoA-carboxylase] ligase [Nocardioides alpinus]PKH43424.1 biotin--[acetyl-CoA-carboxylase] ligase [Nocardioides alpinus]SFB34553.1 BirA family transcriptional regulator, biotin operon repressor / biotin-[acetyl-CoA-carboxylase] ligase [Nocardioides alpinus]
MSDSSASRPPIDPARLGAPVGWRIEVEEATPSTNAAVAARARAGEDPGLVLVTEHQTDGRGRLDRVWETPARSSLTFSVLLRPDVPPESWSWLPLLTGYAVQAALADRLPDIALKWPNDVLVDGGDLGAGRKVAGILVERIDTASGPMAVVGVGINVDQTLDELPIALATSVALETGEPVERTGLLGQVLGSLHGLQGLLDDTAALRRAYADVCVTLGRTVDVHLPGGDVRRGEALDIDATGALVVGTDDGAFTVAAGDVVHVRPA